MRIKITGLNSDDESKMYYKISKFLVDEGLTLPNFTITTEEFDDYMERVYERNDFESELDPYFGYDKEKLNTGKEHFRSCWENGMSPYKALTFFNL